MNQHHSTGSSATSRSSTSLVQERLLLLRKTYADIKRKEEEAQSKRYHRALHGSAPEVHLRLYREGMESKRAIKKMKKKQSLYDDSSCCTSSTVDSRSYGGGISSSSAAYKGRDNEMKVRMTIIRN
ncbi:predicted protein [Chaetoceros tenuissimus]|uniref:Uncharacterized protein n=1 Tax=Chaetoceros tenuissimus TaxID=426638 RepID=A0AAD3H9T9_9STRA|nr:predicted protein [Chaetoceros tenuissimus]